MIQVGSFKEPVRQERDSRLYYFEAAVLVSFFAIGADLVTRAYLHVFAKGRLKDDVIEGSHNVSAPVVLGVEDVPPGKLGNGGVVDVIVHVFFHFKLPIAVEG